MGKLINLTGMVFGRLSVLRRVGADSKGSATWMCLCTPCLGGCGAEHVTTCDALRTGHSRSCGCLARSALGERTTKHGHASGYRKTSEYQTWRSMRARCYRKSNRAFANYGGRGITVCERWRNDFAAFLADMGPKPSPKHSIDRINNNGNYEPGNCRWATDTEQSRNGRRNTTVSHDGATLCVAEWAETAGVTYEAMRKRMKRGWTMEKSLATPRRITRRKAAV